MKPLAGDNVEIAVLDEETLKGSIDKILPRSNALVHPAVANIDQVLMVFAITHPLPNLSLLGKSLVMMERLETPVTIAFDKIDLTDKVEVSTYRSIYKPVGYWVLFANASSDDGMEGTRALIRGKITVLAEPSGVGKSPFTSTFQPLVAMETGTISKRIQWGKHTTRHSELSFAEGDTYMMDTSGFSPTHAKDM